ncbi:metal dependent hydrolase [Bacillus sp. OxB-1]|uniref:EAL and HDOD domain-containing protein n=1 Tax=Bacillus sp. (strain OxB-1) TaxID=98228 RepID=UPI000581EFBB|nr:HDOD domain-containing protein [Bacillus sp. OxB-1]BAQ09817.1 metal dependent hydrolase [Bacillus sp. OxB-1]
MEVFVGRQPIFTRNQEVFAYELLYRNSHINFYPEINGDQATADILINSYLNIGIAELSNGKPCFINFTEKLLRLRTPTFFRPSQIVVEILESIEITKELVDICIDLKQSGYQIALDDFVINTANPYTYALIEQADFIKIDFQGTSEEARKKTELLVQKHKKKMLAEKIETIKDFNEAVESGYTYFQGFFFSKPVIVSARKIPESFHIYPRIINHLSQSEPNIDDITKIIEQDLSLSYKLLKLINTAGYRQKKKINSIRQAIVLLGLDELRKWIYVLSMRESVIADNDRFNEIIRMSLIRARMCEQIAIQRKIPQASAFFITGMFSLMDALLGKEMDEVLHILPLQEDISDALRGTSNALRDALELSISVEKGDWETMKSGCALFGISDEKVFQYYHGALKWTASL